jgi:peptide/nickel transport system permease protein
VITRYAVARLGQSLVVIFLVSVVTFAIIQRAPGGPAILTDPMITRDQALEMARTLGLDRPLHEQYLAWIGNVLRGRLGISFSTNQPVSALIGQRLPATLLLSGTGLLLAVALALPLGIVSAVRRNTWLDHAITAASMLGLSVPVFWLGIMLVVVFAVQFRWLPAGGMLTIGGGGGLGDRLSHLVLPAFVVSIFGLAQLTRYVRSSVVGVLREDYIRTAWAKGLPARQVWYRHALRNALLPMVTVLGLMLPQMAAGAAITETVFAWPGMGRLAIEAAFQRDYPLIMGITLLVSALVIAANLLTDLTYAWLDPRVRLQ